MASLFLLFIPHSPHQLLQELQEYLPERAISPLERLTLLTFCNTIEIIRAPRADSEGGDWMMTGTRKFSLRMLALLMAFLMVLPMGAASAGMVESVDFFITLTWIDRQGMMQTAQALPVQLEGYADCYWAQVAPDAPLDNLRLEIADFTGTYFSFSPANGTVLPPMMDAGDTLDMDDFYLEIMAKTADGHPGALLYLYVSTVTSTPTLPGQEVPVIPAPTPVPTAVPVQPVDVNIHYVDEQGNRIADSTTQRLEEGTWPVYASPWNLPENYLLTGDDFQYVTVNQYGADKSDVYFYYRYQAPATPVPTAVPVQPVDVNIHYVDEQGNRIADSTTQRLEEGTWPVYASPWNLPENYFLTGDNFQYVTVNQYGADKSDVYFYYRYQAPATPAPQYGTIRVRLMEVSTNRELYGYDMQVPLGQTVDVYADMSMLPPEYVPVGDTWQQIRVDEFGVPNPAPVFYFISNATPVPTQT
ncbi:MAG: hypothetical protein E7324_06075, partial [Clostridiales bacterium]|nr:hypothetical protein [Clostridiales bacterium]